MEGTVPHGVVRHSSCMASTSSLSGASGRHKGAVAERFSMIQFCQRLICLDTRQLFKPDLIPTPAPAPFVLALSDFGAAAFLKRNVLRAITNLPSVPIGDWQLFSWE